MQSITDPQAVKAVPVGEKVFKVVAAAQAGHRIPHQRAQGQTAISPAFSQRPHNHPLIIPQILTQTQNQLPAGLSLRTAHKINTRAGRTHSIKLKHEKVN